MLVHVDSGKPVEKGDILLSFRGEKHEFFELVSAPSPGRSGKVSVQGGSATFYITVFPGIKWVEEES